MAKASLYTPAGVKTGEIDLPEEVFAQPVNEALLHEAVVVHMAKQRQGTAQGKNRALVSGTNKKPFKQKGTGRARQGRSTSPLNVRGGKPFAPVAHKYVRKLNAKAKTGALVSALSLRAGAGNVVVFEDLAPEAPKTKEFVGVLKAASLSDRKALVLVAEQNKNLDLASRNIPDVSLVRSQDVNVYDVMWADTVVVTRKALEALKARKEAA
ncbi:MAG: 50S ribosomal protein L4 [Fibrobacteria bacterium]|nr:50S ribosomal protein L4 [Fibrobacteria bacterium]